MVRILAGLDDGIPDLVGDFIVFFALVVQAFGPELQLAVALKLNLDLTRPV